MANQSSHDLLHSFWSEQNMLQLSDASYAEELQLQEALKMSMISSQTKKDEPSSSSSSSSSIPPQTTTTQSTEVVVTKSKGLKEEEKDHEIVWPPMVVIRNTSMWINNKWIDMENQDLLEQFNSYNPSKAHNPQGHHGTTLLIFESSVSGYLDAERLHKSFSEQGLGRSARNNVEQNQLYGYIANKEDMNFLNQGKSKIKYAIKSYKDVITNQIKSLSHDRVQLIMLTHMFVDEKMRFDSLDESIRVLRKKLDLKTEEVTKLRQIVKQQIEEHKEEMESLENFYKDQIEGVEAWKQGDPEAMELELPDQEK